MMRSGSVHYAGKLTYREDIERHYAEHPDATLDQVRNATGAPMSSVIVVFRRLRAAGRLVRRDSKDIWATM